MLIHILDAAIQKWIDQILIAWAYHMWYRFHVGQSLKVLPAGFIRSAAGEEPVRQLLKGPCKEDWYIIGEAIKTVELGWPLGMPVHRPITDSKTCGKFAALSPGI
jgi:hypothetical protein